MLERVAEALERRRLSAVAIFALESGMPFSFVASQALVVLQRPADAPGRRLGALAAGATLALLGGWHTSVFGWTVAAFPILFVASLVLRLSSAIIFIRRIGEPRLNSSNGLAAA